jgi:hypothetical protein
MRSTRPRFFRATTLACQGSSLKPIRSGLTPRRSRFLPWRGHNQAFHSVCLFGSARAARAFFGALENAGARNHTNGSVPCPVRFIAPWVLDSLCRRKSRDSRRANGLDQNKDLRSQHRCYPLTGRSESSALRRRRVLLTSQLCFRVARLVGSFASTVLCTLPWASNVPIMAPSRLIVSHRLARPD